MPNFDPFILLIKPGCVRQTTVSAKKKGCSLKPQSYFPISQTQTKKREVKSHEKLYRNISKYIKKCINHLNLMNYKHILIYITRTQLLPKW